MNDKFTAVLSKVTDSAKEANKSFNENPQDLDTHFTEWVTFSANCLVTAVEDPVKRVGVLRDLLGQALFAAEGGADPRRRNRKRGREIRRGRMGRTRMFRRQQQSFMGVWGS